MKTDVLMATYNSERYLDLVLNSVAQTIPVNRLIVVDHYSTDGTLKILEKYDAEVYEENVSLGFARQVAIDKSQSEILTFIDSDLVLFDVAWWYKAEKLLKEAQAVVALVNEIYLKRGRKLFTEYWTSRGRWFTLGSTLVRREALNGITIPRILSASEDTYLQYRFKKRGYRIRFFRTLGVHYCNYGGKKMYWYGANNRILDHLVRKKRGTFIIPHIIENIYNCFLPALFYHDLHVLTDNMPEHWKYLQGWLQYEKYRRLIRSVPC